jgi:hypothetical protein
MQKRVAPAFVMGALRAIAAILRTTAGLDRQKRGNLRFVGREMAAMDGLSPEHQVGEGQGEQGGQLLARPVVADVGVHGETFLSGFHAIIAGDRSVQAKGLDVLPRRIRHRQTGRT